MAKLLGSAFVNIQAGGSAATFRAQADKIVTQGTRGLNANIPLTVDTAKAQLATGALKAQLADLSKRAGTITVSADDRAAVAKLVALSGQLDRLTAKAANPSITLRGREQVLASIATIDTALDALNSKTVSPKVDPNASGDLEQLGGSLGKLSNLALPAVIAAGVALSPVLVTAGIGLAGLGAAAAKSIGPILQAGTATAAQRQALAQLDPAQVQAYDSLTQLKTGFGDFAKSLEPESLNLFTGGLGLAKKLLGDVQPVAAATGKALDSVLGQISDEFASGKWQSFFQFMASTAGPDVQLLGNLFVQLADDLPGLLTELQPLATGLLTDTDAVLKLVGALTQAVTWEQNHAQSLKSNTGLISKFGEGFQNAVTQIIPGARAADLVQQALDKMGGSAKTAGDNTDVLAGHVDAVAHNTNTALPTFAQMTDNLAKEAVKAQGAASAIGQVNQAWSTFLGLSTSLESAQIGIEGQLTQLAKDAGVTGASFTGVNQQSQALKTDFETSLVPSIQNVINSARQAGANSHDLSQVLSTDLKPAVDAGALSNKALRDQIYNMAVQAGYTGPNQLKALKGWVDKNATSNQTAANTVDNWAAALASLPTSKNIKVTLDGAGNFVLTENGTPYTITPGGFLSPHAAGGFISGGVPGKDSVGALLMPGEVVVPTAMVKAGAVDHLRGRLPGFAGGGVVTSGNLTPGYITGTEAAAERAMVTAMQNAMTAAAKSAQAAAAKAAAAAPGGANLHPTGSGGSVEALMKSMAASVGWTGAEWDAMNYVEMREAGYSLTATNPTSGAYGLAQFINGPSEYADYGGNSTTAAGQITGFINYIKQRYGDPIAAAAHERAFNWYARGGLVGYAGGGQVPGWSNLAGAVRGESTDFWKLAGDTLPKSATPGQRSTFAAWETALQAQQLATIGLGRNGAFDVLSQGMTGAYPGDVMPRTWLGFLGQLSTLTKWQAGTGIRGGVNPPGTPKDSGWVPWHYEHAGWQKLRDDLLKVQAAATSAYQSWGPTTHVYGGDIGDTIARTIATTAGPLGAARGGMIPFGQYDRGGYLPPGLSLSYNGLGRPEPVGGAGGTTIVVNLENRGVLGSEAEVKGWLVKSIREAVVAHGGGSSARAFDRH